MPDIRGYSELDRLEGWIVNSWKQIRAAHSEVFESAEGAAQRLELVDVIIGGEFGRGTERDQREALSVIFLVNDRVEDPTSQSEVFNEIAPDISGAFADSELRQELTDVSMPVLAMGTFDGVRAATIPDDLFESGMNRFVTEREDDPNRAYSLTRDENIIVEDGSVRREPAGIRSDLQGEDLREEGEGDILEFPDLDDLNDRIIDSYHDAINQVSLNRPDREDDLRSLTLMRIVFYGGFGAGNAQKGVDPFEVALFVQKDKFFPLENRIYSEMSEEMVNEFDPSEDTMAWSGGIEFSVLSVDDFESVMRSRVDPERRAYDIFNHAIIEIEPSFIGRGTVVVEDLEEEGEPTVTEEGRAPGKTGLPDIEEDVGPEFEGIPPQLSQFEIGPHEIDVPINKDSKRVEARQPYNFEVEMFTPGDAGTAVEGTITDGIGHAIRTGRFGQASAEGEAMPPSTFPRTGAYIKNRLYYQGPAYALQMYNDLVVYSAYISSMYGGRFVVGTYSSFREYLYRLRQVSERDLGPVLIEPLSQQQAASRGLSTIPELPTGEDAPWLERRQYYAVVEENMNHEAWDNVAAYLYG